MNRKMISVASSRVTRAEVTRSEVKELGNIGEEPSCVTGGI